jgi:DNA-binding CsgD family transcriptional regulator
VWVLGRVGELASIDEFLDGLSDADHPHRSVLITGEPGIGKTVLWNESRSRARALGFPVLSARPVEPESALGFAGLGDLFSDIPQDLIDALPAPQRRALQVALLREGTGDSPADPRSVATAALTVLRGMARAGPLLIAVDDLAWLDASTARVLAFALRRIGSEPIGLVATVRTEDGVLPALATDDVAPDRVRTITPGGLSVGAIREIVADRLEFTPSHRMLVRIHEASRGNPYFALELSRVLARPDPARRDDELAVPDSLRRLLHRRLAVLSTDVREVLLVAALAPGCPPETVVAAAADPTFARAHLETAVAAGVVETTRNQVSFAHPLLRSVLIDDAEPDQKRAVHGRLADVLAPQLASARHRALAATGPDDAVADALDGAAHEARMRGSSETAADLADLAVRMTPTDDPVAYRNRTLAAAEFRFESGSPAQARTMIEDLLRAGPRGAERAALLLQLAKYQRYSGEPLNLWQATLETALDEAGDAELPLRMAIHLSLGIAAFNGGDLESAPHHVGGFMSLAEQLDDRNVDAQVAASVAYVRFLSGQPLPDELIARALSGEARDRVSVEESATYTIAVTLAYGDDPARARSLLERDLADAVERGDEVSLPILLWLLVLIETSYGNWARAEQLAADGLRAAELADNPVGISIVGGARAVLRAAQGRLDEARGEAGRAAEIGATVGLVLPVQLAEQARGLAALSLGDAAAADAALRDIAERAGRSPFLELGTLGAMPLEIEALARLREMQRVGALVDRLAQRPVPDRPCWTRAVLARCRALLLAAGGDLAAAESAAASAVEDLGTLGMRFEHARALLIAGEIQRRARHRRHAQDTLGRAREIFDDLGSPCWSARCTDQLARITGRGSGAHDPAALTDAEQRVADLAAEGYTTREIAGALFTGVRTVEAHLQHVYRKLGVHSRVELTRLLGGRRTG